MLHICGGARVSLSSAAAATTQLRLEYARCEARLGQVGVDGRYHHHSAACGLRWQGRVSAKAHRANGNAAARCLTFSSGSSSLVSM